MTILNLYYAYCATVLAGEVIWAFTPEWSGWNWMGWLKIIGIGITLAGYGLMYNHATNTFGIKLGQYPAQKVVDGLGGPGQAIQKVAAIVAATAVPVGFAAIFLRGQISWLTKTLKGWYEKEAKPIIDYLQKNFGRYDGKPGMKGDLSGGVRFLTIPF